MSAELAAILDELRAVRAALEAPPTPEPVIGYRCAARVIRIGADQVAQAVDELDLDDPRRPIMVTVRGGGLGPWFGSADEVITWWRELHRPEPAPRQPRRRATPKAPASAPMSTEEFHRRLRGGS